MLKILKKWKTKSLEQRKLFFEAFIYLLYSCLLIYIMPFKKIIIFLNLISKSSELKKEISILPEFKDELFNKNDYNRQIIENIVWSVTAASKYIPLSGLCLIQALAAHKMLKKRSISGLLYLGVGKDQKDQNKLVAHAWVKYNNKTITGGANLDKYAVVSLYTW